ncbi:GlcG/HbpS family heme-binding protein [Pseudomonas sp. MWU13-2105]|uniref:GlcG/HbpS family heme-binding protein n=1 Tax=Pseudomonas sp. MWU13-2105 TaxID=2935074 RepID=UPI00200DFBAD|nr:heme-binding protein [Pseudomonas sp. MWU13-2105]
MSALTLNVAVNLASQAISAGRAISAAPLTIAVLDGGGHLVTLQREDGASLLRPQIAIGKAWGAIALGKGSRLLALDAQQRPAFVAALNSLGQGCVVPAPGGVLIRDQEGRVIGAIGITGDTSDIDEQCAISAVEALGLVADAGVSVG